MLKNNININKNKKIIFVNKPIIIIPIYLIIKKIKNGTEINQLDRNSLIYKSAKLSSSIKYLDYQNLEEDVNDLLTNNLKEIAKLHDAIQKEFF